MRLSGVADLSEGRFGLAKGSKKAKKQLREIKSHSAAGGIGKARGLRGDAAGNGQSAFWLARHVVSHLSRFHVGDYSTAREKVNSKLPR